ncbi:hypothetical protein ACS0ZG_37245 [Burkholderia gladioli]|uniref:hypothetical protein n=1 Tax=Burkholderia gladioli TaxID=28095 RepID=UPI003F7A5B77
MLLTVWLVLAAHVIGPKTASGAIGGATSAVLSPQIIGVLAPSGAPLDQGQVAMLAALSAWSGGGLAGLAGQNAIAGATAAQNEALNNSGVPGHIKPTSSFDTNGGEPGMHVDIEKDTLNIVPPSMPSSLDQQNGNLVVRGGGAPNFIVTPNGVAYPVPSGATGPALANNGKGMQFQGGSGGNGLSPNTTGFRFMDPITSGPYQYPYGYGSYNNANGQAVNPLTGKTIPKTDPMWHIPGK